MDASCCIRIADVHADVCYSCLDIYIARIALAKKHRNFLVKTYKDLSWFVFYVPFRGVCMSSVADSAHMATLGPAQRPRRSSPVDLINL